MTNPLSTLLDRIKATVERPDKVMGRTDHPEPGTIETYLRYDLDCAVTVVCMPDGSGEVRDAQEIADWFVAGPNGYALKADGDLP